ncbi:hypothetical protein V1512DRAFT_95607 [Lipomyces arxii]|uniref:uncharacterized protein n=1 Tax=Lipomyces arxii TaxID=56418 RepID=UPI0034CFBF91
MASTNPEARPFTPRHRPAPIQVAESPSEGVRFARSPMLNSLRVSRDIPRTPYPLAVEQDEGEAYAVLQAKQQEILVTSMHIAAQQQRIQMMVQQQLYDESVYVRSRSPSPYVGTYAPGQYENSASVKRVRHNRTSSLPQQTQSMDVPFDEYRMTSGTVPGSSSLLSDNQLVPTRQPLIPLTLEQLQQTQNADLNFNHVQISRLDRSLRGAAVTMKK